MTEKTTADDASPLMLGVSGARGIVGKTLTPAVATRFAQAFAAWLIQQRHAELFATVVVGRDSRPSGEMIESAVVAGLLSMGLRPRLTGIASTPAIAGAVKKCEAAGGLVLTASHNPGPWNGIKPLRGDATAPPPEDARWIVEAYHAGDFDLRDAQQTPRLAEPVPAVEWHVASVLQLVERNAIAERGFRVVLDATCGAGGPEVILLLEALGVDVIALHAEPTGEFPHTPEPTRDNLTELCEVVAREKADLGVAVDPDADRLALVDETGRYIGEEYTLALLCRHRLGKGDLGVTNLSTSRMIDDAAADAGATVVRTPVGEANVAQAMRDHGAVIGGEGNGGVIVPELSWVRDGLAGIAMTLDMLATRDQPLGRIVDNMPAYVIEKDKRPRPDAYDPDALAERARERFADAEIDTRDGIRLDWPDAWLSLRASNTEPILRLIAESPTAERSRELLDQAAALLAS
ncbi:MAG: phosphoglucosamine mutase [Phycisphaeraceae bacterium]